MPSIYDALPLTSVEAFAAAEYDPDAYVRLGPRDRLWRPRFAEVIAQWRNPRGEWREWCTYNQNGTLTFSAPERNMSVAILRRMNRVMSHGWQIEPRPNFPGSDQRRYRVRFRGNYCLEWEGTFVIYPDGAVQGWSGAFPMSLDQAIAYNAANPRRYERPAPRRRRRPRPFPARFRPTRQTDPGIEDPVDYAVESPTPYAPFRDALTQEQLAEAIIRLRDRADRAVTTPPWPDPVPSGYEWSTPLVGTFEPNPAGGVILEGGEPCPCELCVEARRAFTSRSWSPLLPLEA